MRQRLFSENQFNKYLFYSLGEILLVVIGILIALQVNNWNDDRKALRNSDKIINNLELELEEAKERVKNVIRFNNNIISKSSLFVEDRINIDSLKQNPGNALIWTNYAPLNLDLKIVEQETGAEGMIIGREELNNKLRAIKFEAQKLKEILFYMDELWNSQVAPYLVKSRKMVLYDRHITKKEIAYEEVTDLIKDEVYRNLVAMLRLFTRSYIRSLERFEGSVDEALELINQER